MQHTDSVFVSSEGNLFPAWREVERLHIPWDVLRHRRELLFRQRHAPQLPEFPAFIAGEENFLAVLAEDCAVAGDGRFLLRRKTFAFAGLHIAEPELAF